MKCLLLETSGLAGHVGISAGAQLLGRCRLDETRRHARDLAGAVQQLLAGQNWNPRDIDLVIVSRGPGSYTGLRVGLASAQAFAYAVGCPAVAVDTFAVIARQAPEPVTPLVILADAQQDRVYTQEFAGTGPDRRASGPLQVFSFADFLRECPHGTWLSGPALHLLRDRLLPHYSLVENDWWDPQLESLLALGLAEYQRGQRVDLWKLEPLYARRSEAEEKWDRMRIATSPLSPPGQRGRG